MNLQELIKRFRKKLNFKKEAEESRLRKRKRKSLMTQSLEVQLELDKLRLYDAQLDYMMARERLEREKRRPKEPYYVR